MAKSTYSDMQTLNKGRLVKFIVLGIVVIVVMVIVLVLIRKGNQKPEVVETPEIVTTQMVPSTIRYYDPGQEKTFDTGVDYIILTDGSQRVKVDSAGNVSYVTETGQTVGTLSGEAKQDWISQAVTIMQTDQQAAMALAGLQNVLPKEEETTVSEPQTSEAALKALLQEMGISYDDFLGQVYGIGSTLGDVYTMLWMYEDDQSVINSIMKAAVPSKEEETPKGVSVTVEKLGGNTSQTIETSAVVEKTEDNYPAWMQETDPTATMSAVINSLSGLSGGGSSGSATTASSDTIWGKTNQQSEKNNWLEAQSSGDVGYSSKLTKWDLAPGTVIPITLYTGLNTDLPGNVIGIVRTNVYDTLTGKNLLIPKGSRVFSSYNSSVSFGQKSVQIAWTQLITPDGLIYNLPGFQGVTQDGFTGVDGKVNNHFWAILGGAVLGSIVNYSATAASQAAADATSAVGSEIVSGYASNVAGSTLDTTADYIGQYTSMWMSLQPTITIKPGTQMQMLVNQVMSFKR